MRNIFSIIISLNALLVLQGCVPAAIVGGTAALGTTLAEDRSVGQVFSDTEIRTRINAKWLSHDQKLNEMIELQVREGRVLLTGAVDNAMRQIDAVRLAWEVPGVKEVIDETKVGSDYSLGSYAKDTWLTTKVKTELLFQENVQSLNYNVKTVDGTVYLLGIAQNQDEINTAVTKASGVGGVNKVVSYMRVKSQSTTDPQTQTNSSASYANSSVREGEPILEQQLYNPYPTNNSAPSYDNPAQDAHPGDDNYPYPQAR